MIDSKSMKQAALVNPVLLSSSFQTKWLTYLCIFFSGLLGPLGFAPFHLPGMSILSIAFLYTAVINASIKRSFIMGFLYGLGYFGFGVSWIIISIHDYGNLNYAIAGIATLFFIAYLSLFPSFTCYFFKRLHLQHHTLVNALLFSILWCGSESLRATLLTGFPWLLIGTSQIDTPLKYLFPIIGVYGLSLIGIFVSTLLASAIRENSIKRYYYIIAFCLIIITPSAIKDIQWTTVKKDPITIGVVQANLAMRDKWDDALFWNLLNYYEQKINGLLGKKLIILPESAIPLPANYLNEYLLKLHHKTIKAKSSLILGILQASDDNETNYFNSIISFGQARGNHVKRQLVPFGEYIPQPFVAIHQWLNLPIPNILAGKKKQALIRIANHPIASLICYEIAYPNLLRLQMPLAEWVVSISDNGWFGHSLASYQQLQMAQTLALLTGRYHVLANNDGLSSIINNHGEVLNSLPAFSSGILEGEVFSATGTTPWILWGNYPIIIFCSLSLAFILFLRLKQFQQ